VADNFGVNKSYLAHLYMQLGYPVIAIVGAVALLGTGLYEVNALAPLVGLVLVAWGAYDLVKAVKWTKFSVVLSEGSIVVGDVETLWEDVMSAEIKPALGLDSAIVLRTKSGDQLEIPGSIKGLGFITAEVEAHVEEVSKKT
jgi:hypothetical protein